MIVNPLITYSRYVVTVVLVIVSWSVLASSRPDVSAADGSRQFARSDSNKRYLHHIDLYDSDNRKITPESTRPYSPENTCGRCHDYDTISHGWHFNAFRSHLALIKTANGGAASLPKIDGSEAEGPDADEVTPSANGASVHNAVIDGRQGEPWIWTDERTGTQLPLSYRDWPGVFNPADAGIDAFAMTRQFGGRIPGGQVKAEDLPESNERWKLTGDLEVDCMACHAVSGAYDFEKRRDAIENENFAWAPTTALRLGEVKGSVDRIREGSDPEDESVQAKLPTVEYDGQRFNSDGTVFIDLVRHVENNACYQCHSQRTVSLSDSGKATEINERWVHDQDAHLRAGMNCTDCHRNGIDHHITRGFEDELHPSGTSVTTLSCVGCHLGTDFYLDEDAAEASTALKEIANRPGRLGSPMPMHEGLPPIHFEKMSCTACHSGPIPREQALGMMTSLSHGLGSKAHRTGDELPLIRGPLFAPPTDSVSANAALTGTDSSHEGNSSHEVGDADRADWRNEALRVRASRAVWPAFWGVIEDGNVKPLPPEEVYSVTRRALRVRRGFVEEITKPTMEDDKESNLFNEKVYAALTALEEEMKLSQAVYVSTGKVFVKSDEEDQLKTIDVDNESMVGMVQWPVAHNVRPSGWSLGASGCIECHAEDGRIFASTVTAAGPAPIVAEPVSMASLQGLSETDRQTWNQLFGGRSQFKILTGMSLAVLALMMLIGMATKTYAMLTAAERSRS